MIRSRSARSARRLRSVDLNLNKPAAIVAGRGSSIGGRRAHAVAVGAVAMDAMLAVQPALRARGVAPDRPGGQLDLCQVQPASGST